MDKRDSNKRGIDTIAKLAIMVISLIIYCLLVYSCSTDTDILDQYGKGRTNTNKTSSGRSSDKSSGRSSDKSSGVSSVPSPEFDILGGTYLSRVELHISLKGLSDGTIIYTTNGLEPEFNEGCVAMVGSIYKDVIVITRNTLVKAVGCKSGLSSSKIVKENYYILKHITISYEYSASDRKRKDFSFAVLCELEEGLEYKPLLVYDNTFMRDGRINDKSDWALKANTGYYMLDRRYVDVEGYYAVIGILNIGSDRISGLEDLVFSLDTDPNVFDYVGKSLYYWTGLGYSEEMGWHKGANCNNWETVDASIKGAVGDISKTGLRGFSAGVEFCDQSYQVLCVEQ